MHDLFQVHVFLLFLFFSPEKETERRLLSLSAPVSRLESPVQ